MRSCVILVNKPRGLTSNKIVNIVKYFVGAQKAGHLGTLDKLGEGLLPVTINNATKLFADYLNKDKEYIATFKFGEESASYDLETEINKREEVDINEQDILKVIKKFIGTFDQMPPKYSAKNVNGVRAYTLIQKNREFELTPRTVTIHNIELLKKIDKNKYQFKIHCSSGTYIRSLCRDMAEQLSTCGVMYDITRTRCGEFLLKDSYTLKDIEDNNFNVISLESIFKFSKIKLQKEEIEKILQGVKLPTRLVDGDYLIYNEDDFFGVGYVESGLIRMKIKN